MAEPRLEPRLPESQFIDLLSKEHCLHLVNGLIKLHIL